MFPETTHNARQLLRCETVKYFFLTEGWAIGRVWEFGGIWNEVAWRRQPDIRRMNLQIQENSETLWLYGVEDAVLMVEVKPTPAAADRAHTIGQVVLKRLITADQVVEHLCKAEVILTNPHSD